MGSNRSVVFVFIVTFSQISAIYILGNTNAISLIAYAKKSSSDNSGQSIGTQDQPALAPPASAQPTSANFTVNTHAREIVDAWRAGISVQDFIKAAATSGPSSPLELQGALQAIKTQVDSNFFCTKDRALGSASTCDGYMALTKALCTDNPNASSSCKDPFVDQYLQTRKLDNATFNQVAYQKIATMAAFNNHDSASDYTDLFSTNTQ